MRKHGKHARPRTRARVGIVAAAGGAAALVATFPSSPAGASTLPSPAFRTGTAVPAAQQQPLDQPRPAVVVAQLNASRYTIKPGDTLGAIAGQFCGSPGKYPNLAGANHLANPDLIIAGASLDASQRACEHAPAVYRPPAPVAVTSATTYTPRHRHTYTAARSQSQYHVYAAPGTFSFAGLEQLWVAAGGPAWAESAAASVAECESRGRSNAYNPSGATGLWQILGAVLPGNLYDPMTNARNAVSKFEASGNTWAQWVCQP